MTPTFTRLLGFATAVCVTLVALSGLGLAFHYVASPDLAHDSVRSIEDELAAGPTLRSLHVFGGTAATVLAVLVLVQAFFAATYRGRFVAWASGVGLALVVLVWPITGELLPWNEQGVLGTEVRVGLLAHAPAVGADVATVVRGGRDVAGPTLTRFYVLHVLVLPLVFVGLLVLHVLTLRRQRDAALASGALDASADARAERSWRWLRAVTAIGFTVGLLVAADALRVPVGGQFVPGDSAFEAWPEWNMLWLNALLKIVPSQWTALPAFWLPNLLVGSLFVLPLLDRRPGLRRPSMIVGAVALVAMLGLSLWNETQRPTNRVPLPAELGLHGEARAGYAGVRRSGCMDCHARTVAGVRYGTTEDDAPDLDEVYLETVDEFVDVLLDPPGDMPAYDDLPAAELRAMGAYLLGIQKDA